MQIIIPLAGKGIRFKKKFKEPKPLIDIFGKPMILRSIESFDKNSDFFFILKESKYSSDIISMLRKNYKKSKFIITKRYTSGPASTVLLSKKFINMNKELIIANCDQYIKWNYKDFIDRTKIKPNDGIIVTYTTNVKHNSYAKVKKNTVVSIREKEFITKYSLNGVHYWRKAKFFFQSVQDMIKSKDKAPNGEYYVAPTYNYMIKDGLKVGYYHLRPKTHFSLGNINDLNYFLKNEKI